MKSPAYSCPSCFRRLALLLALCTTLPALAEGPLHDDSGRVSTVQARTLLDNHEAMSWNALERLAADLDRTIRLDPGNIEWLVLAARAQLLAGGPWGSYQAGRLADEVLARAPTHAEAISLKVLARLSSGCLPCAQGELDAIPATLRDDPWLHEARGAIHARRAERNEGAVPESPGDRRDHAALAIAHYRQAALGHRSPVRKGVVYRWIAGLEQQRGAIAESRLAGELAAELLPEDPILLMRQAVAALYDRGDLGLAAGLAERASVTRGSAQARSIIALSLYGGWAKAYAAEGNTEKTRAMLDAVRKAHGDIGQIVLAAGSSPKTAFIVRALVEAGVFKVGPNDYRDKDGDTALGNVIGNYMRARIGADGEDHAPLLDLVDLLLARGANANVWSSLGRAPLLALAARSRDAVLFDKLIAAGADPFLRGADESTLLMAVAALDDHAAALRMAEPLFARGMPVNDRNDQGRSALMYAAGAGNIGLLRQLIERGAAVNLRGEDDQTALDVAAGTGRQDVVDALLAAGGEVVQHETPCGRYSTADIAADAGHETLAALLRSRIRQAL